MPITITVYEVYMSGLWMGEFTTEHEADEFISKERPNHGADEYWYVREEKWEEFI